jgi:hypothetical protein
MSRPFSETTTMCEDVSAVPFERRYSDTPAHQVVAPAHRSDEIVLMEWITASRALPNTFLPFWLAHNATSRGKVRISAIPSWRPLVAGGSGPCWRLAGPLYSGFWEIREEAKRNYGEGL